MKHQRGKVTGRESSRRGKPPKAGASVEHLQDLRQRREVTQEELADLLGVRQATVSKLERRDNVTVATLRTFVEALGGELEVKARFTDETVAIVLPYDPAPVSR